MIPCDLGGKKRFSKALTAEDAEERRATSTAGLIVYLIGSGFPLW